jgi:HPt (histidine-containing phosphotransfer) domain-containing protein
METTPPAQLANVVNASVTMFFHCVQRLRMATINGGPQGWLPTDQSAMVEISAGDRDPPLDLVHLTRQCLGDQELEAELLGLFRLQAPAMMAQLSHFSALTLESKARIAHTLRGSALAVGARRVASAAWRVEELAAAGGEQGSEETRAVAELLSSVAEAVAEIERIRA